MSKICLSMIVKDEGHCIKRCLESVLWLIDCYRIVDTGSTDNTKDVIREVLKDIPGEIIDSPWRDDFAYHRNEALPTIGFCGLTKDDMVLMMDADDEMVIGMPFPKEALVDDAYVIGNMDGDMVNYRVHLWKMSLPVSWKFARHELIEGIPVRSMLKTEQVKILIHHEGARSKNENKCMDDAMVIMDDLRNWPEDSWEYRYLVFLVGCCYVDSKLYEKGLEWLQKYLKVATLENGLENLWLAHNLVAICHFMEHHPLNEVVEAYMATINVDPERIEAYYLLAHILYENNSLQAAKMIMYNACKLEKKPYLLKHMATWWDQRDEYYKAICDTIEETANAQGEDK